MTISVDGKRAVISGFPPPKFAKVEWLRDRDSASPYAVTMPGAQTEVSFMLKNSKRFTPSKNPPLACL